MSVSIKSASFDAYNLWLQLSDGRALGVPLTYFPALQGASGEQLAGFELSPRGIHWEELNEDLSLEGLLSRQPLHKPLPRTLKND